MPKKYLFFVFAFDIARQVNAAKKLQEAFNSLAVISIVWLSSVKEFDEYSQDVDLDPANINVIVLVPAAEHRNWEHNGYFAAPVYYSDLNKNEICDYRGCWSNTVSKIREQFQL